jgi:hypothetical protein
MFPSVLPINVKDTGGRINEPTWNVKNMVLWETKLETSTPRHSAYRLHTHYSKRDILDLDFLKFENS